MSRLRDPRGKDGEAYRKCGGKCGTLRTICVKLEEEKEEYLITNIPREKINLDQFKELYFLRWGDRREIWRMEKPAGNTKFQREEKYLHQTGLLYQSVFI